MTDYGHTPKKENASVFLTDADIARLLNLSIAWVRKQRYQRLRGEDHAFDVDPIFIGSLPRYKTEDVNQWIENLK